MPGVPIFFVVSGFLISLSWERNSLLASYARNRALRIYPGLWTCLALSIAVAAVVGHIDFMRLAALPWLAAQITFGQFYNPDFLRGYGAGVLNGSLWTIPVELQFYAFVPLMYRALGLRERRGTRELLALSALSIGAQYAFSALGGPHADALAIKLFGVTLAPYLWMFLLGVLLQRNFDRLGPWLEGHALWWVAGFAALSFAEDWLGVTPGTNNPNPLPMIVLSCATISCAYSAPSWSHKLLRSNDVSYGLYIYHMVVVNAFLASDAPGTVGSLAAVLGLSVAAAFASWLLVERPALRLKRSALHAVAGARP